MYTVSQLNQRSFVDDPILVYLHEVYVVPPLTKDEEADLRQHTDRRLN